MMGKDIILLVMGDAGCGKTSFIRAFISKHFSSDVESLAPDAIVPSMQEFSCHSESVTILDSSAQADYRVFLNTRLSIADTVLILCDATRPESLDNIENIWLPMTKEAFGSNLCKSALLVVTKGDLLSTQELNVFQEQLERKYIDSFRSNFPFLHDTYDISATDEPEKFEQIFGIAESVAIFPRAPVYDIQTGRFTPLALRALQRIFRIHDRDHDCLLSDKEFIALHGACLGFDIALDEVKKMKERVWQNSDRYYSGSSFKHRTDLFAMPSNPAGMYAVGKAQPVQQVEDRSAESPEIKKARKDNGRDSTRDKTGVRGKQCASVGSCEGYFTFRGFLAMFDMLFQKKRVNRMLWTVLRFHGYQPENMECPIYDDDDDEAEWGAEGDIEEGCGRTTLSPDAEQFLCYVYDCCFCSHFQVPNAVSGLPRLYEEYSSVNAHLEVVEQKRTDTSYRYATKRMTRGPGSGRKDELADWLSFWQGLAMCHPNITKRLLFELGLDNGENGEELYLCCYSLAEWSERLRERAVINVALFSGEEHVGVPAVPPSALSLLCALTDEADVLTAAVPHQSRSPQGKRSDDGRDGQVILTESTPPVDQATLITSTFYSERPQKGKGVRYYVATYVPQSAASAWIQQHSSECDLALLVFDSEGRDERHGTCSLDYLVNIGEQLNTADGVQRLFVCVDLCIDGVAVAEAMGLPASGEMSVRRVGDNGQAAEVGDAKNAFHAAVDYVKKTDLPQVEKINALEMGSPVDVAVKRAFCRSLEDVLSQRSPEKSSVSMYTSLLMSWLSALWKAVYSFWLSFGFRFRMPSI